MNFSFKRSKIFVVMGAVLLSACGGGGGSAAPITQAVVVKVLDLSIAADAKAAAAFWIQNEAGSREVVTTGNPLFAGMGPSAYLGIYWTPNSIALANTTACRFGGTTLVTTSKAGQYLNTGDYQSYKDTACKKQRSQPDGDGTATRDGEFRFEIETAGSNVFAESLSGGVIVLTKTAFMTPVTMKFSEQYSISFDEVRSSVPYAGNLTSTVTGRATSTLAGYQTATSNDDRRTDTGNVTYETNGTINGTAYKYKASVDSDCTALTNSGFTRTCAVRDGQHVGENKALGQFSMQAKVISALQQPTGAGGYTSGSVTLQQGNQTMTMTFSGPAGPDSMVTLTGVGNTGSAGVSYRYVDLASIVMY